MEPPATEVTELLRAWSAGDRRVEDRLFDLVLPELRLLARCLMRGERREHTLQATALVNEAYLRLLASRERDWEGHRHFFAVAARIMRRLLIDHARAHKKTISLGSTSACVTAAVSQLDLAVTVDSLLDELDRSRPEWCSVVELKFFMGLTDDEAADALGIPVRTLQRRFGDARRWLFERMNPSLCCEKANVKS